MHNEAKEAKENLLKDTTKVESKERKMDKSLEPKKVVQGCEIASSAVKKSTEQEKRNVQ